MQPWQVILIIVIYDITKGLYTEFLNWKNESSSSSTASETYNIILDRAVNIPNKVTNGDVFDNVFPDLKVVDVDGSIYLRYPDGAFITLEAWRNTSYKEE